MRVSYCVLCGKLAPVWAMPVGLSPADFPELLEMLVHSQKSRGLLCPAVCPTPSSRQYWGDWGLLKVFRIPRRTT